MYQVGRSFPSKSAGNGTPLIRTVVSASLCLLVFMCVALSASGGRVFCVSGAECRLHLFFFAPIGRTTRIVCDPETCPT